MNVLCKLALKERATTTEIKMSWSKNREGRGQWSCFFRSLMLQLAWFPEIAYPSFNSERRHGCENSSLVSKSAHTTLNFESMMCMQEELLQTNSTRMHKQERAVNFTVMSSSRLSQTNGATDSLFWGKTDKHAHALYFLNANSKANCFACCRNKPTNPQKL